jgi:hypothetical protein
VSELNPTAQVMWVYSQSYFLLKVLQRGEHNIENEITFASNTAFVFHDSCGFEAGRKSELDEVKNFVQKLVFGS